ncbi:MAG: alpha/beta hydrolase [Gammaproteobacteria bacterium]|nr:alpha/beta hydrolase [Gammaproteobacteria bacterium]
MIMPRLLLSFFLMSALLLSSCAKYEDQDFFKPEKTSSYARDAYQGYTDFSLENRFDITGPINDISFTSFDGKSNASIYGWYVGDTNDIPNRKIIVYCHDNEGNLNRYWPRVKLLANLGLDEYNVLALDYRGYGKSTGSPSEAGVYADVDAALRWLENQGASSENIFLYGYGLGAAPVIELAAAPRSLRPQKIILEAPFASIESLIQNEVLLNVPGDYLTDLSFDNVDKIRHVQQPMLWLHGAKDAVYDLQSQGQLVFDAHPGVTGSSKFAKTLAGANHYNLPNQFPGAYDEYISTLLSFLQLP